MLFEYDRGEKRGLETVGAAAPDDTAKAAQGGAGGRRFVVIGQPVEILLNGERRA